MKHLYLILILLLSARDGFSQTNPSENFLSWSSTRKLTASDFGVKTSGLQSPSFAQFSIEFEVGGFDFVKKNLNKQVQNRFIKSASWLDTTYSVHLSIKYQQTLFDLCEIYTRQFRKALKANRKKVLRGTDFVRELNAKAMADFSTRRIEYDRDTKFGADLIKQKEWEDQIQWELAVLKDFAVY